MSNLETIDLSINISYPILFLFIILGILYTFYIYRYTIPATTKLLKSILIFLRATAVSLIIILIFEPTLLIKYSNSIEPVNLVFVDNSYSIVSRDSADREKSVSEFIDNFSQQVDGNNFYYTFSSTIDTIANLNDLKIDFNGSKTNFQQLVDFINSSEQNIASATIISDGIINDGSSSPSNFDRIGVSIYTVSIGDTTLRTDLSIKKVVYNDLIYSNSPTEFQIVLFNKYLSDENVILYLYEDSKLIEQKQVKLDPSGFNNVSLTYTPKFPGEKSLRVAVSQLENEETYDNNKFPFVINVLNNKIKLLLISGAPSSDYTIIKKILSENKNISVDEIVQTTKNKFLPDNRFDEKIDSADVFIMIDFPTQYLPQPLISSLTKTIKNKKKSFFFILSQSVDQNKLMSLDIDLPFKIRNNAKGFREIVPSVNSIMDPLISTSTENITLWNDLPPIFQTESDIIAKQGSIVLVNSKVKNAETDIPLVITKSIGESRSIALNGFGIWKWKIQSDKRSEYLLESLINNSIKWLYADKHDQRIFVSPIKKVFTQNDEIEFRASIYDETLTPRNDANIKVNVSNQSENYDFVLKNVGNGIYEAKLNTKEVGEFRYKSIIELDNSNSPGPIGKFIVSDINIENINYVLNKNYLKLITNNTSGKSFEISDYRELFNTLNFNQKVKVQTKSISTEYNIWASEWMLGLIVLLFSIEWFLRKQKGLL